MRFFFFGSLMDPAVASIVLGREIRAEQYAPATLVNFRCVRVAEETYPALVPALGETVFHDPSDMRGTIARTKR